MIRSKKNTLCIWQVILSPPKKKKKKKAPWKERLTRWHNGIMVPEGLG